MTAPDSYDASLRALRDHVDDLSAALAEQPLPEGQDVSDWEMREYFEFY